MKLQTGEVNSEAVNELNVVATEMVNASDVAETNGIAGETAQ